MSKKVAIIGMGYIALEMCEALRARSIDVDMIKPRPAFLPWMEKELAEVIRKELETPSAERRKTDRENIRHEEGGNRLGSQNEAKIRERLAREDRHGLFE